MTLLVDSHCHLDHFPRPAEVAAQAANRGVLTIAVTNLPSHFLAGLPHARALPRVRLALGLHPLAASEHEREWKTFERHFGSTSYISEVGLDSSREGKSSLARQMQTFRRVVGLLASMPKFVSVHSRRAERPVLETLADFGVVGVVFHWYSGPVSLIDDILAGGHYFSVNPMMLESSRGRSILEAIPKDRLLTESDGPFGHFKGSPTNPWDVGVVVQHLARVWSVTQDQAREQLWTNFSNLIQRLPM